MSIASSLCAESVNRTGEKVIRKMEQLKNGKWGRDKAIEDCIALVKKHFTEWTE